MRTGAIFTRGSCRALKWMALLGVVFALGAGSATAQALDFFSYDLKAADNPVMEGESTEVTLAVTVDVPETTPTPTTVTVTMSIDYTGFGLSDSDNSLGEGPDATFNAATIVRQLNFPANTTVNPVRITRSFSVTVQTTHDEDAENEEFVVNIDAVSGGGIGVELAGEDTGPIVIDDDEEQEYVLTTRSAPWKEGQDPVVTLSAKPPHEDLSGPLTVQLHDPSSLVNGAIAIAGGIPGTVIGNTVTLGSNDGGTTTAVNGATITVTTKDNDGDRTDDAFTLRAYSGVAGRSALEAELSIELEDTDPLPAVTAKAIVLDEDGDPVDPQPDMVESITEGDMIDIEITVVNDRGRPMAAPENLKISLMPTGDADERDYEYEPNMERVSINSGARTGKLRLTAVMDEDVGMETLMFDAVVSGVDSIGKETSTSEGVLSLAIMDTTEKKIWPTEDAEATIMAAIEEGGGEDGLNPEPSESFMLMMSDLFGLMDGYTAAYDISVEGDAISATESGDTVTIMTEEAGMAKVTVTGVASMASSSFMPSQSVSDRASITFDVMVTDTMLTVELSADPMEIMEGEMSKITATANRNVTSGDGDVMVALRVVGDGTLDMDSIMIPMGEMSASAMLTATEDDDDYMDETVTVVATGSGIMDSTQVPVMVMDNDMAPSTVTAKSQEQVDAVFAIAIADARSGSDWTTSDGPAMVDMSMLFDMDEGAMATYSGMSSNEDVVSTTNSGMMLTLSPMMAGMATITVTATDAASGDVATAMSDVMVMLDGLTYSVMADEMNLVEDMDHENGTKTSATVTVMASRELAEGEMAEIMLMRDGSSTASMDDYTVMPEMVTLMAGDMEATFTVMAVEDNMPDGGAGMPEMLTLFVSLNGMQMTDKSVMFYLWDHAVPALPIIAQLLLAAFLAIGGYRRYLRRR